VLGGSLIQCRLFDQLYMHITSRDQIVKHKLWNTRLWLWTGKNVKSKKNGERTDSLLRGLKYPELGFHWFLCFSNTQNWGFIDSYVFQIPRTGISLILCFCKYPELAFLWFLCFSPGTGVYLILKFFKYPEMAILWFLCFSNTRNQLVLWFWFF